MKKESQNSQSLNRRAMLAPQGVNLDERTAVIVFATSARVSQFSHELGIFNEELEISEKAINMKRLENGTAPFLNMHQSGDLSKILGVVEEAWIDEKKGECLAKVRFPRNDEEIDKIWNLITQGIIRNISVGYTVEEYLKYEDGDETVYRAKKWTPLELSAVTVPADENAFIRTITKVHSLKKEKEMNKKTKAEDKEEEKEIAEEIKPDENDKEEKKDEKEKEAEEKKENISRAEAVFSLCEVAGLSIKEARLFKESRLSIAEIREKILEKKNAAFIPVSNTVTGNIAQRKTKTLAERAKEVFLKKK